MNLPLLFSHFCDAVWEYNINTNEIFLHHDNMDPELCGCWMPYDEVSRRYQETYVYPLDLAVWQHYMAPEALRSFYDQKNVEERFYIRFENTQKGLEQHEVYLQKLEKGRVLLASRDTREMQRAATIAKAIVPEFDFVARIDLADSSYVMYYSNDDKPIIPQSVADNYDRIMEEYNRRYVVSEEVEALIWQMKLDRILKELEEQEEYIVYATVQEEGRLAYKKLRFSYEDETKRRLLATRTDVGAWMGERKLREKERIKRLAYLDNMPVAFCSTKVLLDDAGKPYDFQFTYCNKAHEELEGVGPGELLGKNFYEFFRETDPKWLQYYYETAYQGIFHVIRRYSPEIQKHLLIYTFQSEPGHCECALLDVSEEYFLTRELERSRETMKRILEITTDRVFQYLPERSEVILDGKGADVQQLLTKDALHQKLLGEQLLHPDDWEELLAGFLKIKSGEHTVSFALRGRSSSDLLWNWFQVTMFDFLDEHTHERKVFGFLQNIQEEKSREEALRKKAELDSLTEVLNVGAGKRQISKLLERRSNNDHFYSAMFVMDLDNFKTINDTRGHIVGDKVLTVFAQILRRTFRTEDVIYRLGGDEFVVFIEKLHDATQSVASMLHQLMAYVEEVQPEYPFLACSVGVLVTDRRHSFEECYELADQALYEAKRSGKGRFCIKTDLSEQEGIS